MTCCIFRGLLELCCLAKSLRLDSVGRWGHCYNNISRYYPLLCSGWSCQLKLQYLYLKSRIFIHTCSHFDESKWIWKVLLQSIHKMWTYKCHWVGICGQFQNPNLCKVLIPFQWNANVTAALIDYILPLLTWNARSIIGIFLFWVNDALDPETLCSNNQPKVGNLTLNQSGGWGLKKPHCGPLFFKYFR